MLPQTYAQKAELLKGDWIMEIYPLVSSMTEFCWKVRSSRKRQVPECMTWKGVRPLLAFPFHLWFLVFIIKADFGIATMACLSGLQISKSWIVTWAKITLFSFKLKVLDILSPPKKIISVLDWLKVATYDLTHASGIQAVHLPTDTATSEDSLEKDRNAYNG